MIRVQTNVVLKYFEPVDDFVRIRLFTPEEAKSLLAEARIVDKRSYVALVLNACLVHYNEQVLSRLKDGEAAGLRFALEDRLFALCVEANPHFDLRHVTIPAAPSEGETLHLLEQRRPVPEPAREFRRLGDMEEALGREVVGQGEAIAGVSRAVRRAMTGLRDPERPVAAFFFVGQTGVGKTELAKALTRYLYGDAARLARVDCSEYAMPHEYAKLLGAPPGYVGHDAGGVLAEARRRGAAVLLFDEIEKSDAKVHDLLLQLMDEGVVTDNKGDRLEFRDAILILTSNVGAGEVAAIRDRIGFDAGRRKVDGEALRREMGAALRKGFRPEFVNRLTEVLLFNALDLDGCEAIARRFLAEVVRHAEAVPLTLRVEPPVARHLAAKAYRPEFGAREVRRTVERDVEGALSGLLVDGVLHAGDSVTVAVERDRLDFRRN
jgi:ATP-dependent Clp protease ATP-binding subunit ClpC